MKIAHIRFRLTYERRVLLFALAGGLPAVATALVLLFKTGYSVRLQWTLGPLIIGLWLGFCFAVRERVANPLRTLASLLEALREGDYSIRARVEDPTEPLGEVME